MESNNKVKIILRLLKGTLLALVTIAFIPILYLATILVYMPETLNGFLFGVSVWLFAISVISLPFSLYLKKKKKMLLGSLIGLCLTILLLPVCYFLTPNGKSDDNSKAKSVFTGTASYNRFSIANLVPEIDQLKLGTYAFSFIDPFIDDSNSSRIRKIFLDVYREMRGDDEFNNLGSVLNLCYDDMFTGNSGNGHLYEYIPDSEKPLPVIMFIHGSLGNFKGYLWCWKKFADKNGFAVVAPTFGAGNWNKVGGIDEIRRAFEYCSKNPKLDAENIYIAGLSNGGKGVSRIISTDNEDLFKGIIYISAVMEEDIVLSFKFVEKCRDQKILVIHGAKDRRIPLEYITPQVNHLKKFGINVKEKYYPQEDHFLMFSSWDEVQRDIEEWIKK